MKLFAAILLLVPMVTFAGLYGTDYEYVGASATNQKLGPVGGSGDVVEKLIIVPETTAAGNVSLTDGTGFAMLVFKSGTLSDLSPIVLDLGLRSVSADWNVTTGTNVHVIAVGKFK